VLEKSAAAFGCQPGQDALNDKRSGPPFHLAALIPSVFARLDAAKKPQENPPTLPMNPDE
jgi:hypothetical protein